MVKQILGNKMLQANFYSTLFYAVSFPYINKLLISNIDYKFISVNALIICLSVILWTLLWQKYERQLFRRFAAFLCSEIVASAILLMLLYIHCVTYLAYYLIETILFGAITKNIIMGSSVLQQLYFDTVEKRKEYDIQSQMTVAIASIIGYLVSIVFSISLEVALICCFVGITVDNVLFAQIYKQYYNKYQFEGGDAEYG